MAGPTTGVIDSFNRADAASLGSDWIDDISGGSFAISGNAAVGETSGDNTATYDAQTFGPDAEAWITFGAAPTFFSGVWLRQGPGAQANGYRITYDTASSGRVRIERYTSNVQTLLTTVTGVGSPEVGGGVLGRAVGGTISVEIRVGGVWVAVTSADDATYATANNLGILMEETTGTITEFGGGTVVAGGTTPRMLASSGVGK